MVLVTGPVAVDPDRLDPGLVLDEGVLEAFLSPFPGGQPLPGNVVQHVARVVGQLNDPHASTMDLREAGRDPAGGSVRKLRYATGPGIPPIRGCRVPFPPRRPQGSARRCLPASSACLDYLAGLAATAAWPCSWPWPGISGAVVFSISSAKRRWVASTSPAKS